MGAKAKNGDSIDAALLQVRYGFKTHQQMASVLGISVKTLERYIYGHGRPKPARRPRLLRALVGVVDIGLLARVALAMEVPESELPDVLRGVAAQTAQPRLQGVALEASLELALFGAAEQHDVASKRARQIALAVLKHVIDLGVQVTAAHSALSAADTKRRELLALPHA